MRVLYDVCDKAEEELSQICRKAELTKDDLDNMYKLIDIVKDIKTVEAMKKADEAGWSNEYSRDYARENARGYSEDYSNAYPIYRTSREEGRESGYSYRRGRDSMGRYTSREEGYSRHNNPAMIEDLKEMMMNARSEEERESYRKTIENLTRS